MSFQYWAAKFVEYDGGFLSYYDAFGVEAHRGSPCQSCDKFMTSINGAVQGVNPFMVHTCSLAGDSEH